MDSVVNSDIKATYKKVLQDATKMANRRLREEIYQREGTSGITKTVKELLAVVFLGWNPIRPNPRAIPTFSFTMSDMDAYRLQNDQDLVQEIVFNSLVYSLIENKVDFLTVFLQDILIAPAAESIFDPPKWDPSTGQYRDVRGRFTKAAL